MSRGELAHNRDRCYTLCEGLRRTRGTLVISLCCHHLSHSFRDFVDRNTVWFIDIPWAVTSSCCRTQSHTRTHVWLRWGSLNICNIASCYFFLCSQSCKMSKCKLLKFFLYLSDDFYFSVWNINLLNKFRKVFLYDNSSLWFAFDLIICINICNFLQMIKKKIK